MTYKDALFEAENWNAIPEGPFHTTQHRKLCNDDTFSFLRIIHAVLSKNKVLRDKSLLQQRPPKAILPARRNFNINYSCCVKTGPDTETENRGMKTIKRFITKIGFWTLEWNFKQTHQNYCHCELLADRNSSCRCERGQALGKNELNSPWGSMRW